ncbi:MAG TPA: hypothetical protein VG712_01090 [Gemmatimonadales bacterium]|nr:hypothetical protein [Gemmatimonadales bacterium]
MKVRPPIPHPALRRDGLTLVEVLVAVWILTVGILALLGTSVSAQRLLTRGRRVTEAVQLGERVLDSLRRKAHEGPMPCAALASDPTGYSRRAVAVTWSIGARATDDDPGRLVQVILSYTADRARRSDTLTTVFACGP